MRVYKVNHTYRDSRDCWGAIRFFSALMFMCLCQMSALSLPYPDSLSSDIRLPVREITRMGQQSDSLAFETYHALASSRSPSTYKQLWLDLALADAYLEVYEFTKAFNLVQQTADAALNAGEKELQALALIHTALIHEWLKRGEDCKRYLDQAKQLINESFMPTAEAWYEVRLASYYTRFDRRQLGYSHALRGHELGRKFNIGRAYIDGAIMLGILAQKQEDKVRHFETAATAFAQNQHYYSAVSQYDNVMNAYLKMGQADNALSYKKVCDSLLTLMTKIDPGLLSSYHKTMSDAWILKSNLDSAYFHLVKSRNYLAEVRFAFNQEYVNQQEISYAIERQEAQLLAAKQRNNIFLAAGLLTLGLLILSLVLYKRAEQQRALLSEQTKMTKAANLELQSANALQKTLLTDVHHRVKNNLQLISSLLAIRSMRSGDVHMEPYLTDITQKIKSISLMHEHLYQNQKFESVSMLNYLEDLIKYFVGAYEGATTINYDLGVDGIDLNLETVIPLGLMVTELISNSLKHGMSSDHALQLHIRLGKMEHGRYQLRYSDNGPGLPGGVLVAGAKTMGATIIQSMVRQLAAEYHVTNNIDTGASFTIIFEEKEISQF